MSDLKVINLFDDLRAHLSARSIAVIEKQRFGSTPEMMCFGQTYPSLTPATYRDFAERLNFVTAELDGRKINDEHRRPTVDAALSMPMAIPLANLPATLWEAFPPRSIVQQRYAMMVYWFVYDVDAWRWHDGVGTFDTEAARKIVNRIVGHRLTASKEGTVPCEHGAVKECTNCKAQFCIYCLQWFPEGTREEIKTVAYSCDSCGSLFGGSSS